MKDQTPSLPTVSVVIPMHQAGPWIGETLASVEAQTYPIHECIVVDDGSVDNGADVVRSFADHATCEVRLISQPNAGVSAARNAGLALATGELIALLDADDLWLSTKIARQVDLMDRTGAVFCLSGYAQFDSDSRRILGVVLHRDPKRALRRWLAIEGSGLNLASSGLIRRSALERVQAFDPRVSICEDLEFTVRIYRVGPVAIDRSVQVGYRSHNRQAHRELGGVATNTAVLFDEVLSFEEFPPGFARKCRAGLDAYVGFGLLRQGRVRGGLRYLSAAAKRHPLSLATIPVNGICRKLLRRFKAVVRWGTWPATKPAEVEACS